MLVYRKHVYIYIEKVKRKNRGVSCSTSGASCSWKKCQANIIIRTAMQSEAILQLDKCKNVVQSSAINDMFLPASVS